MKKIISLLLFAIIFFSCERDDLCDQVGIPNVRVGFYEIIKGGSELPYKVDSLEVIGIGVDSIIMQGNQIEEIKLPLRINDKESSFKVKLNSDSLNLKFTYDIDRRFISKGCGFGVVYKNIEMTETTSREGIVFDRIKKEVDIIENEQQVHYKIFFTDNN